MWFRALGSELARLTYGVAAARHLLAAMHGERDMGKLGELGDRIKRMKETHDLLADELSTKLMEIEGKLPDVRARAHNYLDSAKGDISSLDSDMRQLSNSIPSS